MRMPTSKAAAQGILRVVPPSRVLMGFAQVFSNNTSWTHVPWHSPDDLKESLLSPSNSREHEVADRVYEASKPTFRVGTFVSHVWNSARWRKFLALCYSLNVTFAVVTATLSWLVLILGAVTSYGLFGMGGRSFLAGLFVWVPTIIFFLCVFWGHLVYCPAHDMWVDKLCIHQTRAKLKESGVNALPEIVATSDKMIMLWDPEYFDRLWCCAEVAIFCSSKGGPTEVEFVPLWVAPWVLSTILTQLLCISISERLFSLIGSTGAYLSEAQLVPENFVPLVAQFWGIGVGFWLGALPTVPLSYYAMKSKMNNHRLMRRILRRFDLNGTKCAVESDREQVLALVGKLYRDYPEPIQAFNSFVRKDLAKIVEQKVVGASEHHIRYRLCLLIFLPVAFSSAANIFGCDGIECYVAATEELGPGAVPPEQMGTNLLAWLVGVFFVYPTSYPVMLRLMLAAENRVGKSRLLPFVQTLAIIVADAYMGFAEGLVAGLLNSTTQRLVSEDISTSGPWIVASTLYLAVLLIWNWYLYRG
ncbi:unnamed protein product [Effrenium voratum]|nr:unnamed protein product [Effrenium voratum]